MLHAMRRQPSAMEKTWRFCRGCEIRFETERGVRHGTGQTAPGIFIWAQRRKATHHLPLEVCQNVQISNNLQGMSALELLLLAQSSLSDRSLMPISLSRKDIGHSHYSLPSSGWHKAHGNRSARGDIEGLYLFDDDDLDTTEKHAVGSQR